MRWLFWLLALFALAVAVALGARMNEGYVLLVVPPWRLEVSLNLFLFALAAVLILGYGILRGISMTVSLPTRAREFRERRARERAVKLLQDSLLLLQEGRFGQALKRAIESHESKLAPGLSALIAARAAQRLRQPEKQRQWIEQAKIDDPEACEAAALMLEAEMGNDQRAYADALAALQRLYEKHGRHIAALRLELRARQGLGDWNGILRLARQLEKRRAMSHDVAHEIRLSAHLENIQSRSGDAASLLAYLRAVPSNEKDQRLALAVARELHAIDRDDDAGDVIVNHLGNAKDDHWHEELVALYGLLPQGNVMGRIAKAESWLQDRPRDAHLLLALGRMCRRLRLWGKAQSYLEASLAVGALPHAHLELARLFEELERNEDANRHYRQSVELAI